MRYTVVVREMSRDECLGLLSQGRLARLGCASENQPYVVPIYYAYHKAPDGESYLYGFTTVGQKVEWMRANPRVCVEWDEVTRYDQWVSVIVFGRYEELPGPTEPGAPDQAARPPMRATLPEESEEDWGRRKAYELLQEHTTWWQPGAAAYAASGHRDRSRSFRALYYRIRIDQVTGHRASPDAPGGGELAAFASE